MTPIRLYLAASDAQLSALAIAYLSRSTCVIRAGVEALHAAGVDVSVPEPVSEPAAMAEIAVRHRDRIGRVPGFGPYEYAEMVAAMRSVFGELHPDDPADLASLDLWEIQDRHTGESVRAEHGQRERGRRALLMLRASAADNLL